MSYDVLIIGGGLAGLSAAVDLSRQRARVLLLEQNPRLGGRTYSYRDRTTGDTIDNGQHLLMGCYQRTREYLQNIGSSHLASLQKSLHIDFLHARKGAASLHCPPLPPPLNVLGGLLRLSTLSIPKRLRLIRMGAELLASSKQKESELASLTVEEWLLKCGQPEENRKYLWDVIAVGSLNDETSKVSALLFYRVLKAAFLGARENSSLLIPRVGLSELLVEPAAEFVRARGGTIRSNMRVTGIENSGNKVSAVVCGSKRERAQSFICAVPHFALRDILPEAWNKQYAVLGNVARFDSSPIITINLWFDRPVMDGEFAAVLDSTIQWVFNKTAIMRTGTVHQYLSLVISAASNVVNLSKERLTRTALHDLNAILPETKRARVLRSLVIKEKRATFSPTPAVVSQRPGPSVGVDNFFFAGDWTDTGFPATIEGAVLSGHRAAAEASRFLHSL